MVANGTCYQYPGMRLRQVQVGDLYLPGAEPIKGYMEFLPPDYSANPTKNYPLLVYMHGIVQFGNGKANDSLGLCNLFGPSQWTGFPTNMVEGWPTTFPDSAINPITKESFSFIFISPQFSYYDYGNPNTLNTFIDYLVAKYRVDRGRIYLAAISKGASYTLQYIESTYATASRIAACVLSSPCDNPTTQGAMNLAQANLPIWATQCSADSICYPIQGNPITYAETIASAVNSQNPAPNPPVYATVFPMPGQDCKPLTHDTWGWIYDKDFKKPVNGGPNVNAYEWMVQYSRNASPSPLPVNFTSFNASLSDNKVYLNWSVAQESNNREFTIERAGSDQKFTVLSTIASRGNVSVPRTYQAVDNNPLSDISYYRLSQTDKNGKKTYYETRRVINTSSITSELLVSPNPFVHQVSVYVTLKKAQRLSFTVADITGKRVQYSQNLYPAGGSEISIKSGSLPSGIYFLKVEGEGISYVRKIVKD